MNTKCTNIDMQIFTVSTLHVPVIFLVSWNWCYLVFDVILQEQCDIQQWTLFDWVAIWPKGWSVSILGIWTQQLPEKLLSKDRKYSWRGHTYNYFCGRRTWAYFWKETKHSKCFNNLEKYLSSAFKMKAQHCNTTTV